MTNYLTRDDVSNYGADLVDFSQRAAAHALSPQLLELARQQEELRQRLAREARARLDREVEQAVPTYRDIDRDPAWHRYLLSRHPLTGLLMQQLLNDAITSGSAARVIAFFEGFQRENQASSQAAPGRSRSTSTSQGKPIYTRSQIDQLYAAHRKGLYRGREAEWARLEVDIFRALREGRVTGGLSLSGEA